MGWPELFVVAVVAMLLLGPERLPDLARQAGIFVRAVRRMVEQAKNDLGSELGHDLTAIDLKRLDPREVVRKALAEEDDPVLVDLPATAPER